MILAAPPWMLAAVMKILADVSCYQSEKQNTERDIKVDPSKTDQIGNIGACIL
jgi:hypothetical protein